MIDLLDKTIENIIKHDPLLKDSVEVSFSTPNGEWASRSVNRPTLNFFLYDVRENAPLRRHQWHKMAADVNSQNGAEQSDIPPDPSQPSVATMQRTPLMIDCFYMVSAWSSTDERLKSIEEHRLLSRCLTALARYPILNPPFVAKQMKDVIRAGDIADGSEEGELNGKNGSPHLNGDAEKFINLESRAAGRKVSGTVAALRKWIANPVLNPLVNVAPEVRTRLAYHDILTNPAEVWGAMGDEMKAAFSYVVTLPIDPWANLGEEVSEVGAITFDNPPPLERTERDKLPREKPEGDPLKKRSIVGGLIRKKIHKRQQNEQGEWERVQVETPSGALEYLEEIQPYPELDVWLSEKGIRVSTNENGRFTFRSLPPDTYTVQVFTPQDPLPKQESDFILPTERDEEPLWSGELVIHSDRNRATQPLMIEVIVEEDIAKQDEPKQDEPKQSEKSTGRKRRSGSKSSKSGKGTGKKSNQ